jgi:hypothetical protein
VYTLIYMRSVIIYTTSIIGFAILGLFLGLILGFGWGGGFGPSTNATHQVVPIYLGLFLGIISGIFIARNSVKSREKRINNGKVIQTTVAPSQKPPVDPTSKP